MSLFSHLFGRRQAPTATDASGNDAPNESQTSAQESPADPVELQRAIAALQNDAFADALALALPHVGSTSPQVAADANRLCALSLSRLERYPEAFDYWLKLFAVEESAHNALQLATTSVMCDEVDRGQAWLVKAEQLNDMQHDMSPVMLRANFISALSQRGHWPAAFEQLQWMKGLYEHLQITDATFLHLRGVPFFSTFLEKSLPIVKAVLSPGEAMRWYASLQEHVDEEGSAAVDTVLDALRHGAGA